MMRPRIFLADDHCLLLEAFRNLLEPKYEVVGTAAEGWEMLAKVSKLEPDAVLLDIGMPKLNGFDAAEKLKKILPKVKIIFLTMKDEPEMVTNAFKIGASGYLLKSCDPKELFEAVDVVLSGGRYTSPQITEGMVSSFQKDPTGEKSQARLTLRQREVLQLLAEGKTMKEVASVLFITPRTVAFHKYQIMEDLNLKNNSELMQYAFSHGITAKEADTGN